MSKKMLNPLDGNINKLNSTEEKVSALEDRGAEIIQTKALRKRLKKKNEQSLSGMWDNIKKSNIV